MPTYTLEAGRPDDGVHEVGDGPFPDLPAGIYRGNFYGNDPRLGRIQAGDQKYSVLSNQEGDVASSGNTFQVGTGPQPGLPSGVFRPDDVQAFLRDQARLARAEAAAAQPQPPQINFAAPTAAPVQTTLPSPVAPVAVPSFVPGGGAPSTVFSGGTPNIGVDNLLALGAAGAPGATGVAGAIGAPGIPGFVSPLQLLLPPTSTVPATGSNTLAAPNISSGIPASVFSQLFPSVPDISQTAPVSAAGGGPILASDSLPRYESGGEAEGEARRKAEVLSQLRPYLPDDQLAALNDMPLPQLEEMLKRYSESSDKPFSKFFDDILRDREQRAETWMDMAPPRSLPSPEIPPITPYEIPKNYYPPEYEFLEEGPTELDYDMRLPEQFQNPSHTVPSFPPGPLGVRQAANGGPILAFDYLNCGGPVRKLEDGGDVDATVGNPAGDDTGPTGAVADIDTETGEVTYSTPAYGSVSQAQIDANAADLAELSLQNPAAANEIAAQNVTEGGFGSLSPAAVLGANSEMGTATIADMVALNAPGLPGSNIGYAINDPTGTTPGAITASQIAAQQNPTLANAIFGVAGLIPGVGPLATVAGALEGRGLLSLAQQANVPGAGALSDAFSSFVSPFTNTQTPEEQYQAIYGQTPDLSLRPETQQ